MPKTKPKNKGGRPKEDIGDKVDFKQAERLAGLGLTDNEIGIALGICEKTVRNWKKDKRFLAALKKGKLKSDKSVVKSLYKRALGFSYTENTYESGRLTKKVVKQLAPDTTACIFWLKNRRPDDWRDKREVEIAGKDGGPIGVVLMPAKTRD